MTPLVPVLALLVSPVLAAAPAAAAPPPCDTSRPYAASSSADLAELSRLDLRPLGLPVGPVAGARLASTASGLATGAGIRGQSAPGNADWGRFRQAASAAARHLLGPTVHQQAPPAHAGPVTATAAGQDLGAVSVGTGTLRAQARPVSCDAGPSAHSSATVLGVTVLRGALVRVPATASSQAAAGLIRHDGGVAAGAGASVALGDLRLFAGSRSEIAVRVLKAPALQVATSGAAPVKYTAPILEISGPGIPSRRVYAPGTTVDLGIPVSAAARTGAAEAARAAGLPLLGGDLRGSLSGTSAVGSGRMVPPLGLSDISGLPPLPALQAPSAPASSGSLAVLRLSLGDLRQAVSDHVVRASAVSLRLQVFAGSAVVVDLGLGLLQAAATAPRPAGTGSPPPRKGLPITGIDVGAVVVLGAMLFVIGRVLTVLALRWPRNR